MAASNFPTPAPMDMKGDLAHNWSFFQSQFENYEIAVGLDKKAEAIRVATLLSVMGKECFRVFKHIEMADDDRKKIDPILQALNGRRGGLMVSALDSGSNGPGSSPGRGHCVVFLSKALNSHSASLHPGV